MVRYSAFEKNRGCGFLDEEFLAWARTEGSTLLLVPPQSLSFYIPEPKTDLLLERMPTIFPAGLGILATNLATVRGQDESWIIDLTKADRATFQRFVQLLARSEVKNVGITLTENYTQVHSILELLESLRHRLESGVMTVVIGGNLVSQAAREIIPVFEPHLRRGVILMQGPGDFANRFPRVLAGERAEVEGIIFFDQVEQSLQRMRWNQQQRIWTPDLDPGYWQYMQHDRPAGIAASFSCNHAPPCGFCSAWCGPYFQVPPEHIIQGIQQGIRHGQHFFELRSERFPYFQSPLLLEEFLDELQRAGFGERHGKFTCEFPCRVEDIVTLGVDGVVRATRFGIQQPLVGVESTRQMWLDILGKGTQEADVLECLRILKSVAEQEPGFRYTIAMIFGHPAADDVKSEALAELERLAPYVHPRGAIIFTKFISLLGTRDTRVLNSGTEVLSLDYLLLGSAEGGIQLKIEKGGKYSPEALNNRLRRSFIAEDLLQNFIVSRRWLLEAWEKAGFRNGSQVLHRYNEVVRELAARRSPVFKAEIEAQAARRIDSGRPATFQRRR